MTATEVLKHEHQVILMVLAAAERQARAAGRIDADRIGKLLDFIRNFADRCHHAKEEKHLFARMVERGFSREAGPVAVMLAEHDEGRRHVRVVAEALPKAEAGDGVAAASLREHLLAYVELLRRHIDKEDDVLYAMADQVLTERDQRDLSEAFDRVEAEEMGKGVHERYHQLAHELAET